MEIPLHFPTTTVYWLGILGLLGLISAQYINLGVNLDWKQAEFPPFNSEVM